MQLEPPSIVGRDTALERLRASGQQLTKAIASLSPERGSGYTVTLLYGTMSLFEFADFVARHVARHDAQIDRTDATRPSDGAGARKNFSVRVGERRALGA